MRDSIGGSFVLVIIMFFLVVVSAYLAFNVNYMKAFKMKDKIISYYEEYNGNCNGECSDKIRKYAKSIGYEAPNKFDCSGKLIKDSTGLFCSSKPIPMKNKADTSSESDIPESYYYKVETIINIEIPIIDNLLGLKVFKISGDTKVFQSSY